MHKLLKTHRPKKIRILFFLLEKQISWLSAEAMLEENSTCRKIIRVTGLNLALGNRGWLNLQRKKCFLYLERKETQTA